MKKGVKAELEYNMDFELYRKLVKLIQSRVMHTTLIKLIIAGMLAAAGIALIIANIMIIGIILIVAAAAVLVLTSVISESNIKKNWQGSSPKERNLVKYEFYEDHFTQRSNGKEARVKYEQIKRVIETNEIFLIVNNKNMGYLIPKNQANDELAEFLREVCD